ncbi:hypothetical protein [Oceanirhabdus sp. W0125-5]|uniref:hypothetical protein n=1 Tax=Oceanirhabdus sp. W0125-5 TaxID=2999116 RepID=UPI0022F2BA93|nr:hypothetical protein [Oceanirhabdus sp. W0125-5]WBW98273.1 hypothetical protein OW730_05755 [Oceanirhabdus sp. W0125-5]
MKRMIFFSLVLIFSLNLNVVALTREVKADNLNAVFKKADEISPGLYKKWENARNKRENLKDALISAKRKQWEESAEDREAIKETISLEEEYLLHQYNEGILNEKEYGDKLKAIYNKYDKERVEKNKRWLEGVKKDSKRINEYKEEMKSSFNKIVEGINNNNKEKVERSFNEFLESYEKTTEILMEKFKEYEK